MITRVRLKNFKQFRGMEFDLAEHIVLAGPNNSGKSTLLQAVAVWHLALQRWLGTHSPRARRRKRRAVPVTRNDFTAIPLREMNLLWTDTSTALTRSDEAEGPPGYPRPCNIVLEGRHGEESWELAFEFRYQSREQIYVKPAEPNLEELPPAVRDLSVVHVPPFSGIGAQETRYDRPYQNLLIGQGKPGDLLRNLLLEVYQRDDGTWEALVRHIRDIFQLRLLPPRYEGTPYILSEYVPGREGEATQPGLDISCGGSGFHQVLLLLAFFYARPATILLLDEPDAHQHVILQKQIYDLLRRIATERGCQLLVATHSEVLLNDTAPERILSFFGQPHRLVQDVEREQMAEALKRLPAIDLLLADQAPAILYLEGETDFNLLRAWARVLDHPLHRWFAERPFWHSNRGRHPREARGHFFALRALRRTIRGVLLLDGDNRQLPEREVLADGLTIERWKRYEAESYLLHPAALLRFLEREPLFAAPAREYLRDQLPPAVWRDPLGEHDFLINTPASKTLLPGFFHAAQMDLTKEEYYLVAEQMRPAEIPPEVVAKLDTIAAAFGLA